ncbi:MAG: hypothetical protein V4754_20030 [Pseudomonadota bacterium]
MESDRTKIHLALGRDGHPLGRQPHGGANSRAAVPVEPSADGRRHRRHAHRGPVQREQ